MSSGGGELVGASRRERIINGLNSVTALMRQGQAAQAVALAEQVRDFAPEQPIAHAALSWALRSAGRVEAADHCQQGAIDMIAARIQRSGAMSLQQRMLAFSDVIFLGGPPAHFVEVGQMQRQTLIEQGLRPHHRLLDIGCGCLRAGVWVMQYLQPGHYAGIEPNRLMLKFGLDHVAGPEHIAQCQPRFDHNSDFNLAAFGLTFDFFVARSIWTHTDKQQIEAMLDGFGRCANPGAVFLASYRRAASPDQDYKGRGWVGRSDISAIGGLVAHDFGWVQRACERRGLTVRELGGKLHNHQIWLRIERL